MSIVWSGLAPHPPIIVDSVGGARCREVQTTIDSMHSLAADCLEAAPKRLIVISPHTPRPHQGVGIWLGAHMQGSFSRFGAPQTTVNLPVDQTWVQHFCRRYPTVANMDGQQLDHGAMVPLFFLTQAGWSGKTVVLGLPWDEDAELDRIGDAVAAITREDPTPTALLASGDMSHCLMHGAPCGYDPAGAEFDQAFVDHLKNNEFSAAVSLDAELRENAKQDVVESCRIAWRAMGYRHSGSRFLSYEGPFGVGYTVMKFHGSAA